MWNVMNRSIVLLLGFLWIANLSHAENEKTAILTFDQKSIQLGSISSQRIQTLHYSYTNTGTAPLVLTKVDVTCGCIKPKWSAKPVMPGKKGTIDVIFDPKNKMGTTRLSIYVKSNASNKLEIIRIDAIVNKR